MPRNLFAWNFTQFQMRLKIHPKWLISTNFCGFQLSRTADAFLCPELDRQIGFTFDTGVEDILNTVENLHGNLVYLSFWILQFNFEISKSIYIIPHTNEYLPAFKKCFWYFEKIGALSDDASNFEIHGGDAWDAFQVIKVTHCQ